MSAKKLKRDKQIVCISPQYWGGRWFRKQHFMSRFHSIGYKVAYVDPSFSMVRKSNISRRDYSNNSFLGVKIEEITDNFFVIKPPKYLPFYTRPIIRRLNHLYIFLRISLLLKKLGFKNYILWIYEATPIGDLRYFKYKNLVFGITDYLPALYGSTANRYRYIEKCTKSLVQKSDMVLVTAYTLLEKYKKYTTTIHLVPNGYDATLFSSTKNLAYSISEIEDLASPIIGFIGTLFIHLDYNLLKYIIEKNMDKSFIFVGHCDYQVRKVWEEIIKYKNVIWLGRRRKEEIPAIIDKFDVCINPFKIDELSKSVSPLKVFEYLAMRKPVVSVEMESLKREKISKLIYFAKDYDEFNRMLYMALKNPISMSEYQCIEEYSWDSLFDKVFDFVEEL